MDGKERFRAEIPRAYFLDPSDLERLNEYLAAGGWLAAGTTVLGAEKAGEGVMNCTVRVRTSAGSFILKQSRPWAEKFPQVAAPLDRALIETRFYRLVASSPLVAAWMPRLLWSDESAHLFALEDLGATSDFFPLYARRATMTDQTLHGLVAYLSALHRLTPTDEKARADLANSEMRTLNHEHLFALPLRADNGLDLDTYTSTPGLAAVVATLQQDAGYVAAVTELGERYRTARNGCLVHGDFYPGSFLQTAAGVKVIDPEFCFCGDGEFDLGVFAAHLLLVGEPPERAENVLTSYRSAVGFSEALVRRYAGVEIMRRLIGVAQIPNLQADLARKTSLLELSRRLVLEPERKFKT